jgi:hypothetical protein
MNKFLNEYQQIWNGSSIQNLIWETLNSNTSQELFAQLRHTDWGPTNGWLNRRPITTRPGTRGRHA